MSRELDTATLDSRADHLVSFFHMPDRRTKAGTRWRQGPSYVAEDLYNATYKDEFDYLVQAVRERMGATSIAKFDQITAAKFTPREKEVFEAELRARMAVGPDGKHLGGKTGRVEVGRRIIGYRMKQVRRTVRIGRQIIKAVESGNMDEALFRAIMEKESYWVRRSVQWPIYFGEEEERQAIEAGERDFIQDGLDPIDPIPPMDHPMFATPVGANVTNFSAESIIAGIDGIADRLDEGSTAATIRCRTGSQPADPDASETGTLLGTLTCSDPAVNGGVDDTDGTCSATFDTITGDSSADATGTLGYCRFGATGTGADDHIDGNATTDGSGATDWNTLSFVSGSAIEMTSAVLGQSQGSTAT